MLLEVVKFLRLVKVVEGCWKLSNVVVRAVWKSCNYGTNCW